MEQNIKRIDASFSVAGQIGQSDLHSLAALGFATVMCNRPDHEGGPQQPEHAALQQAAQALGLRFVYLPSAARATDLPNCMSQPPNRLAMRPPTTWW